MDVVNMSIENARSFSFSSSRVNPHVFEEEDRENERVAQAGDIGDSQFSASGTLPSSTQDVKETRPWWWTLSLLLHLSVFGVLGKLFGPRIAGVTRDHTALYLDLPSNVVGSFLMGWLGVVFKEDICRVSDLLALGLTTGYLGSLTTFSGWNQKMLDLSVEGRWVVAAVGILLGMLIVAESIRVGVETAKGFRWILKKLDKSWNLDTSNPRNECRVDSLKWHRGNECRVDSLKWHRAVMFALALILILLLGVSGVLLGKRIDGDNTNTQLWMACIVAPLGVWCRWLLARLNGRGFGSKGLMKWVPFGTLVANISAACMMAALATVKKEVNTKKCDIIATGIQFGFLGCLSTVSTFVSEFYAMRQSTNPWRAYAYGCMTILPSFILGTLIYSVPDAVYLHSLLGDDLNPGVYSSVELINSSPMLVNGVATWQ